MECLTCGHENRDAAKFCEQCGAGLPAAGGEVEAPAPIDTASEPMPATIAGRYEPRGFLGRGGRKSVYLARDATLDRDVALALLDTEGVNEAGLARVRREAQAMGKLGDHPHVVTVYDAGDEDGIPYIVSQYMPGGDVASLLDDAEDRRLEIPRAIEIAIQVARALEHAHLNGIVHRDIKPANVWLTEDGTAMLGDFGLATTGQSRRGGELLVGTVAYMPPEQALGKVPDARGDVYSLGALLYESLAGQPPFPGDDAVAIIGRHLNAAPVPPSRHNPAVPPALDELVLRMLAKSTEGRPQSAHEVAEGLAAIAAAPEPEAAEGAEDGGNPLDALAGGVFVGRGTEVGELRTAFEEAQAGRGGITLLVGEPGIGKTRTAEELATYARLRKARVYWGHCHEGDGAPPFWPWVQVLRAYVREADPIELAWELGPAAAEIAQLVPELGERMPGLEPPPPAEGEQARFRLFDAITTFLTGASRNRPLVVVLDDLHWADEPSLRLLRFLAHELAGSAVLVLGTYRDVELRRDHPLHEVVSGLLDERRARRVRLHGLGREEIGQLIERTAGIDPDPGLVKAIHEETEGNPFFVAEIVRLMASEGRFEGSDDAGAPRISIPQGVREAVGRRLNTLSERANEVLAVASVVGREFDAAVVSRVCGCGEELTETISEALAARVLEELPRQLGRYRFAHALIRETLYEELSTSRRVQLHREIGAVLEELHGADLEPHLPALAYHFYEAAQAGEVERAVKYATRAGEQAAAELAYEDAALHLGRALEALELSPPTDPAHRWALLFAIGENRVRAGELNSAREAFWETAALARQLDDAERLARAALAIRELSEAGIVDQRLVALFEEVLERIETQDSALRVELLAGLSRELVFSPDRERFEVLAIEAVEVGRRVGDDRALAAALVARRWSLYRPGDVEQRVADAREMIVLTERSGDREFEIRAYTNLISDLLELGDMAGVDRAIEAYDRLAGELRQPQHLWNTPLMRGMRALIEGRMEDAMEAAEQARRGGERAQEPVAAQFHAVQMSQIMRARGRIGEMLPELRRMSERYGAGIPAWRASLAVAHAELGRLEEARVEFERLAADGFAVLPLDAQWLSAASLLAEVCCYLQDAERARDLYAQMAPHDGLNVVVGAAAAWYGPVSRYLGLLAYTFGDLDRAEDHLRAALEMCVRTGARPFAALARFELATALLARKGPGDHEAALEELGASIEFATEAGMSFLVERALAARLKAQGLGALDVTSSIEIVASAAEAEGADLRAHAAPDGSVTILFSDIENSTQMTERLGDARWLGVLRAHNTIFREHVESERGFEVKSQGDGFMLAFASARAALRAAAGIQRAFATQEVDPDERVRVRMGLHTGEAIAEEGDFFGVNVILAARIAAQASGGEVLVSANLKQATEGADGLAFDDGRELDLKGLRGTHRVYRLAWEPAPAAAG